MSVLLGHPQRMTVSYIITDSIFYHSCCNVQNIPFRKAQVSQDVSEESTNYPTYDKLTY